MSIERQLRHSKLWFLALSAILLASAQAGLSLVAVIRFQDRLVPEITLKAEMVGDLICDRIAGDLDFDADPRALRGVDVYFDKVLEQHPELLGLAVTLPGGQTAFSRRAASARPDQDGAPLTLPIRLGDHQVATLRIDINRHYAESTLREMTYDVATVLTISLLITFGLLSFLIQARLAGRIDAVLAMVDRIGRGDLRPQRAHGDGDRISHLSGLLNGLVEGIRDLYRTSLARLEMAGPTAAAAIESLASLGRRNRLTDPPADDTPAMTRLVALRLVTFVFFLAEELIRPFLPLYVKHLTADMADGSTLLSLPFAMFILVAAAAQPWGGAMAERWGHRRVFMLAAGAGAAGLAMVTLADNYWLMLCCRMASAIGNGVVFATCQSYAIHHTTKATRARGMAMFVAGVMAAAVCGPSIGGMIADHFGYLPTLLFAAAIAAGAIATGRALLGEDERGGTRQGPGLGAFLTVLAIPRMLALMLLVAVPAKILLNGALFYLTPLALTAMHEPQSVVGRVMMSYGIATIVLGPLAARFADAHPRHHRLGACLGATIAGLALMPAGGLGDQFWVLVAGVAGLGIGQSLSMPTQLALVTEFSKDTAVAPSVVFGVFRFVERAGGALGPVLAGWLVDSYGYGGAVARLGQFATVAALAFPLALAALGPRASNAGTGAR